MRRVIDYYASEPDRRTPWTLKDCLGFIGAAMQTRGVLPLFVSGLLSILVFSFLRGHEFSGDEDELDVNTGRIRHVHIDWFHRVSEKVVDTSVTKLLSPRDVGAASPHWVVAWLVSPNPPDLYTTGALYTIRDMDEVRDSTQVTLAAKRLLARRVVALWQHNDYHESRDYVESVLGGTESDTSDGRVMDVGDLPPVPRR